MSKKYPKLSETKLDKNTAVVRANFDVKLENGEIVDDSKIKAIIPTIEYLTKANCKVILLSHLGKDCTEYNDELSFIPIRFVLGRLLGKPLKFVNINSSQNSIKFMEFGDVLLLENLCFEEAEFSKDKQKQEELIKQVADFADYYIDESFGVDQNLASTSMLPKLLKPLLGLNYEQELKEIENIRKAQKTGFVSLIGGKTKAKKLEMLSKLVEKSEIVLLGGQMAQLFLKAQGVKIKEDFDKELIKAAKGILNLSKKFNTEIALPIDLVVEKSGNLQTVKTEKLSENDTVVDLGEESVQKYQDILYSAKFLIINGPLGLNNQEESASEEIFAVATLISTKECYKVVGGEETMAAIGKLKIKNKKFNHVSTSLVDLILAV